MNSKRSWIKPPGLPGAHAEIVTYVLAGTPPKGSSFSAWSLAALDGVWLQTIFRDTQSR